MSIALKRSAGWGTGVTENLAVADRARMYDPRDLLIALCQDALRMTTFRKFPRENSTLG
jgi:hypothetical protein